MGFLNEFKKETGAGAGRGVNRFFRWITSWESGNKEEGFLQKNSGRIAFVSLLLGLSTLGNCSFSGPQQTFQARSGVVGVVANLTYGVAPRMPEEKKFAPTYDKDKQFFFETGGVNYFRFRRTSDGSITQVTIPTHTGTCVLVPAREKIGITTIIPPRYVVNMENNVSYTTKVKYLSQVEKIVLFFPNGEHTVGRKGSWEKVRAIWPTIETKDFVLVATALDRTPGGLVCF